MSMLCFLSRILSARFLCELSVETGTSLFLLEACKYGMCKTEHDTENLNRNQLIPELASLHAEHGSGSHGRARPWHQVQDAHRKDCNTKQRGRTHVHLLVNRKHGWNDDQEGRRSTTIEVADEGNDGGHHRHADDIVPDILHEPVDDNIKHAGIGHDTEEEHGENKQCGRRAGALEATVDKIADLLDGIVATEDQDQAENGWKNNESHAWRGLTLKQRHDKRNDTCES